MREQIDTLTRCLTQNSSLDVLGEPMIIDTARGEPIIFDDADAETVMLYSWVAVPTKDGKRFYAVARISPRKRESMHRFIMKPPYGFIVHHRNNNGLDNRRENLVVTTQSKNIQVARYLSKPSVHMCKKTGRWRVQMRIDGVQKSFGMYAEKSEALVVAESVRKSRLELVSGELL